MTFFDAGYRQMREKALRVGESRAQTYRTGNMALVPERLVRCVWYDQRLDAPRLKTTDGRRIRILSQGEWNSGAGPDFFDGSFIIEGEEIARGDIELHVRSADWRRHGHDRNPAYCSVALHVALWNDYPEPFVLNSRGEAIPQIILADFLESDIESLENDIDMENYPYNCDSKTGLCKKAVEQNPNGFAKLLEMAGRERLFSKSTRFRRELRKRGFDEVLYMGMMEAMGYRHNKAPFRRLADAVPLKAIRKALSASPALDRGLVLQSLFFGASGLFSNIEAELWDEETRAYCAAINEAWEKHGHLVRGRLGRSDWTVKGVRPANFPLRRMAGAARLVAEKLDADPAAAALGFAENVKSARDIKSMKKLADGISSIFRVEADRYWSQYMVPGGKRLDSTPPLIGKPLADSIVLNIIIPALLCRAIEQDDSVLRDRLIDLYSVFPRLESHGIAKIMCHRLWGSEKGDRDILSVEMRRQGLIQLFFDFCDENIQDCEKCSMRNMLDFSA